MKQIAFFTTDWNYELVGETLRGVSAFLDRHPDVCVRVFDCFGIDEQVIDDSSVYDIYSLAELDRYDGVIVQTHQIVRKDVVEGLLRRLKEKRIPAVTIGTELGDLPIICSDDFDAFYRITTHLIEKHGARKIWFLKGEEKYDNMGEAVQRREGFTRACEEAGIPGESIRYLEGNWKAYAGENAARVILAEADKPDALVCANDDMALGAVNGLREGGISVPEDMAVTGFDGIFSANLCTPILSTIDRNFQDVGRVALETVMAMINGETPAPVIHNRMRERLSGTCGCGGNEEATVIRIKNRFYLQSRFLRMFYLTQDKLSAELFAANSVADVMDALERYSGIFGDADVRLYLDERYFRSATDGGELKEDGNGFCGTFILAADSADHVSKRTEWKRIQAGDAQTETEKTEGSRLIQYYPLRYGRTELGVVMIRGLCRAAEMNLHESIINMLAFALETIRQQAIQRRLNERLNTLYTMDQLTGLHNRFGVQRYGEPLFSRLISEGKTVRFLFVDVDDMKGINDRYGHATGDTALKAAADLMRKLCVPGDYMMRYGGDEFFAIGASDGRDLTALAREELARINSQGILPCRLDISVGVYERPAEGGMSLEECLQEADTRMYEKKRKKHGA